MELDKTDKKLLYFLQEDSKQTTKELANKLDLSVFIDLFFIGDVLL